MQPKYILSVMALWVSTMYAGNADIIKSLEAITRSFGAYQNKLEVADCISNTTKHTQKIKAIELNKKSISEIIGHLKQSNKHYTHNFLFALDIHLSLL